MFYPKLCNDFSKSCLQIFKVLNEMVFNIRGDNRIDCWLFQLCFCLVSNFDSSDNAIRKVSTHLTEEPFSDFSKALFIASHLIYYQRIDKPSLLHERHTTSPFIPQKSNSCNPTKRPLTQNATIKKSLNLWQKRIITYFCNTYQSIQQNIYYYEKEFVR